MQKAIKNHTLYTKIFDNNDIEANNRKVDIKEEDEQNIDLFILNSYLHLVTIMQIC